MSVQYPSRTAKEKVTLLRFTHHSYNFPDIMDRYIAIHFCQSVHKYDLETNGKADSAVWGDGAAVKYLTCEPEDLSSIPRTYVKTYRQSR